MSCDTPPTPRDPLQTCDPVCLVHGLPMSQHRCLYCCLCFRSLEERECNRRPDGHLEDVCLACAAHERMFMRTELAYLFLDFDGVIRTRDDAGVEEFRPELVERVNRILAATGAVPVVVSNHRKRLNADPMWDHLNDLGLVNLPASQHLQVSSTMNRADAVLDYLAPRTTGALEWAVLDDEMRHYDRWSGHRRDRVVCPNGRTGVDDQVVRRVVALLNRTPLESTLRESPDDEL